MKIVHVVRQYYPFVGGLEFVVHDLAKAQVAAGDDVSVVTLRRRLGGNHERLPDHETIDGVKVTRIGHVGSRRYPIAPAVIRHLGQADIVHVHSIDFFFDFLSLANYVLRKTLVVSTHGGFFHTQKFAGLKAVWFSTLTRFNLRGYSAVICISEQDGKTFRRLRSNGIRTIVNGVNTEKYRCAGNLPVNGSVERGEGPVLVTIGRFAPNKQYDRLLDTLVELRRQAPWELNIIGAPDQIGAEQMKAMIEARGLGDAVRLHVSADTPKVRDVLGQSDLFVSASSYEGFGVAAVEALSAGLDVALNDIKPYRDLVGGLRQGLILDFNNTARCAGELQGWWSARRDSDVKREERMMFAEKYSIASAASATKHVYQEALGTQVRHISGLDISVFKTPEALGEVAERLERGQPTRLIFANSNLLTQLKPLEKARLSEDPDCLVLNDGIALDAASVILYGKRFPSNLNGTDFLGTLFGGIRQPLKIFLIGAQPGIAELAGKRLKERYPHHEVVGIQHGYFKSEDEPAVIEAIRRSGADTLLCAMGNPLQERWLDEHLAKTGCTLGIAAGAYLDFLSGNMPRAPHWMRDLHLEWLYRLSIEPKRLFRRYTVDMFGFFAGVVGQAASGQKVR